MSFDAKQLCVVVGIVVVGVVLGLTVSALFLVLLAGPIVVLIQYGWQNSGWGKRRGPADPSRALFRDVLVERRANRLRDDGRADG